jgi:hypothetical protein
MTTSVWKWAGQTELGFRSGQGIVGHSASSRALVLLYVNESEAATVQIPLQADGRPCPPFDGGEIISDSMRPQVVVAESKRIAVVQAAAQLCRSKSDSTFRLTEQDQQIPIHRHPLGVTAIAYRINANGDFAWVTIPKLPCTTRSAQPVAHPIDLAGVRVAVIPDTIVISQDERRARKTLATLASPFTVAGDAATAVVAAPVVVVYAGYVLVYLVATPRSQWVLP